MSQPQIGTTNQIFHPKLFSATPSAYKLFITESRNSRCAFSKFFNLSHPDAPRELARGIVWKWPVATFYVLSVTNPLHPGDRNRRHHPARPNRCLHRHAHSLTP